MPIFSKLSNKLLLLWFGSIALSLSLAGLLFTALIESHYSGAAKRQISDAFEILRSDFDTRQGNLVKHTAVSARRQDIVASTSLIETYQDPAEYQALIFDPEKRKLAVELERLIRTAAVDVAAIFDGHGRLVSFAYVHGAEQIASGFISYQDGREVAVLEALGGERPQHGMAVPPAIAALRTASDMSFSVNRLDDALIAAATAPVLREFPDGTSAVVGHIAMADILRDEFVNTLGMRSRAVFSFSVVGAPSIGGFATMVGQEDVTRLLKEGGGRPFAAVELPHPDWFLGGATLPLGDGGHAMFFFGLTKDSIAPNVTAFRTAAAAVLLFTGLLVIPAGIFFINRTITGPVARLVAGVEAVRQGRYEQLSGLDQSDELGSLARSFNGMAETIKVREEELRKLSRAVEGSPASVIITDTRGVVEYVNRKFTEITGYSREEVLGKDSAILRPESSRAGLYTRMWDIVLSGGEWRGEIRQRAKDGRAFWAWVSLSALAGPDGKPAHVVAIAEDVTARKEAEQELHELRGRLEELVRQRTQELSTEIERHERTGEDLRRSKERLRLVVENVVDAIVTYDEDGTVQSFNPAAEQIFGYKANEIIGLGVANLLPDATRGTSGAGPLGSPTRDTEIQGRRRNGDIFPMDVAVSVLMQEGRRSFICIFRDITERKRYETELMAAKAQAEAANEAKSSFLSSMSHELRTPMNAILGFGQLLASNSRDPLSEKQAEYVNYILKSGRHLLELINEVLDLAKIESGTVSLSLETIDPAKVVAECVSMIQPLADRRHIAIEETVSANGLPRFRGDLTRVKQVLVNLLSNAIKYNVESGRVSVDGAVTAEGFLRLQVTDTGPGIPADRRDELFEPFNRLGVESSEVEGTGIGLTICKQLMELMGGKIGFESREGQGSTFFIDFPPTAEPAAVKPVAGGNAAAAGEPAGSACTLLYVEDNPSNLRLMEEVVAQIPAAELLSASTAEAGLELARSRRPDIILMDINLPGMDGYAALRHLRSDDATRGIPVLALSANALPKDVERGLRAGFQAYLTKPVDIPIMMNEIHSALARTS